MTYQTKNSNSNYLTDPQFTKVNILFALSFENDHDLTSFLKYYTLKFEIKDFNVLIDGKSIFVTLTKNKEETYEKINEMSKNKYYAIGNLLD